MLKTAEIPTSQVTNTQSVNGRHILYAAFRSLVHPDTIKDYPRWNKERNKKWIGGLTAEGNVPALCDVPLAVILRESKGMTHLVVANKSVSDLDRAALYKRTGNGWEFAPSDPSILMDARQYKWGRQNKIIAICRFPDNPMVYSKPQPDMDVPVLNRLAHEIAFEVLTATIKRVRTDEYPEKGVLTSPVWRDYNSADRGTRHVGGSFVRGEDLVPYTKQNGIN